MKRPKYLGLIEWENRIRAHGLDIECYMCQGWGCDLCSGNGEIFPNCEAYDIQRTADKKRWQRYFEQF